MTPEQQAPQEIDRQLEATGWIVQDYSDLHITVGLDVDVRELMRFEGYVPTGKGQRTEVRGKVTKLPSTRRRRKNG